MTHKILIAGFGGQGVMLMGELLSYAAFLQEKNPLLLPEYGGEQRGGTSNCSVIISDDMIGSPSVKSYDTVVLMNTPSYVKFSTSIKNTGTILTNYPLVNVEECPNYAAKILKIPADRIADEMHAKRISNMIMLGALAAISNCVDKKFVQDAITVKLGQKKPELLAANLEALDKGYELSINLNLKEKDF